MSDDPKPTGVTREVTLTGGLFPWVQNKVCPGEPLLLSIPGSPLLFLPVFADPGKLRDFCRRAKLSYTSIKRIDDGADFLHSILEQTDEVRIIVDPYFTPEGRVRYFEVRLPSEGDA